MSKKNYNKMYNEPEKVEHVDDVVEEINEMIKPEPEPEEVFAITTGIVACDRLNVRQEPSKRALILGEVTKGTELVLDEEGTTEDFYKVYTATGIEGFCMKQFITIK